MKYILNKTFTFEASHRLIKNYNGKCRNNHGHTYKVVLRLEGKTLDEKDMLIDFYETKILKNWIDEVLDHSTLLWEKDPMIKYMQESHQKLLITKKNPTAEHIAELIMQKAIETFQDKRIKVNSIEINETCTSGITLINE